MGVDVAFKLRGALDRREWEDRRACHSREHDRLVQALKSAHGWTEAQIGADRRGLGWFHTPSFRKPMTKLEDDAEGAFLPDFIRHPIFPDFDEFKNLEAVKTLWYPEDAQLDDSTWLAQEPLVLQALGDYAEMLRVHAIRIIHAAQSGRALKSLSMNPANYPADEYDAAFFGCITARVFVTPQPRRGGYWTTAKHVVPFPAAKLWNSSIMHERLARILTFRHVWAVRTVLAAASLDEAMVTPENLDALGDSFRWPACPRKRHRGLKLWKNMVELLKEKGPRDSKLKAGATVELEYVPPYTADKDLKGKGKAVEVDPSGEDSDSGSDASSDEDGSTSVRRRRRRNLTDDSEGDDDANDAPRGSARLRGGFYTSEGSEDEEDEDA
ncbi:hypothetical protein JCM10450v2_006850 [Rhodotorula kratochvilovae]